MCECMKTVNDALAPVGGRLAMGFAINPSTMEMFGRLLVVTDKVDKSKRKPLPAVPAAFCPFCGEDQRKLNATQHKGQAA